MRVSLVCSGRSFEIAPSQSILDAAIAAGLRLAHDCRSGNCGACRARLVRGEAAHVHGPPLGLSAEDLAAGMLLMCRARALGDLEIEVEEIHRAEEVVVKRLPCRIARVERLAHDVIALYLRLPSAEDFAFLPGQYLDVILARGGRRSFSIASPPHDARPLELHVRRAPGGEFTESLFAADPTGKLLTIEGPRGAFHYHPPGEDERAAGPAPMLLIAGGTGYAPIQSILRHLIERGERRDLRLYFGARTELDLYVDARIRELVQRAPELLYRPVLSEPSPGWRGRRGPVHEAVLAEHARLDGFDVYACGPPAMIEAVRRTFPVRGADPARIYFDSFDYSPDSPIGQRSSAPTIS